MSTTTAVARSEETGRRKTGEAAPRETRIAWAFLAPFAVLYVLFLIWPVIYMVISSFFNTTLVHKGLGSFAGGANYAEMLSKHEFWVAMWNTIWFTILTVVPLVLLAFVLAILANRVRRGQWFFRLAFFLPFILPSAAIGIIWNFIYTPDSGLWNQVQKWFGNDSPSPVLATPHLAMIGIAIATIWWTIGFNFVLYLAGLQDIPRELYEAAAVDGATPWQQIRSITVPMLSPTTQLVVLLQIIASLKIFDQVYLMTGGGPGISTEVVLQLVTNTAFTDYRVGAASAASVLLFLVILIVALVRVAIDRIRSRKEA
ncbi:carbohydrate ABC transporter permease [Aestuariimicrobium sp. T2.26MG-19.2B]|uniref:carbohydrate ABC transporter permease n=1 Tax=Aestuariimicrobium sp. T2.26MG-19.2B TaxID=3040679 RepID=UPI002477ACA3|nr:sugar ABC transporter permease [Aestuariimicrobium sp. T2.26MG-19.2B]CAI9405500.1 Melibiose/raffinose/stachyose import permease protein MelD [Aestuariimicrobium sp. T2.26MG-19.2B]